MYSVPLVCSGFDAVASNNVANGHRFCVCGRFRSLFLKAAAILFLGISHTLYLSGRGALAVRLG
jgi:hypothetical protein